MSDYDDDYITLKWGGLKAYRLRNPALEPAIAKYNAAGNHSVSAMAQRNTQEQKEAICEMIDIIGKPVYNDWSGEEMAIEEAKKYVMEYGNEQ